VPELEEEDDQLTPFEDNKLRAAGYVPAAWWHPTKHIIVEDEYRTNPRFTMIPGRDDLGGDYSERLTVDEVIEKTLAAPDAPGD
jgi:hypothetical protein